MIVSTLNDRQLRAQLDAAGNDQLREIHAYWSGKRCGDRLPSRGDIDPAEIPRLLPCLFLVDVIAGSPARYRYRLLGTRIAALEGEITGRHLDEIMAPAQADELAQQYHDACRGRVYLTNRTLVWQDREHVDYSVLLLPLAEDGRTVDMLLGYVLYESAE